LVAEVEEIKTGPLAELEGLEGQGQVAVPQWQELRGQELWDKVTMAEQALRDRIIQVEVEVEQAQSVHRLLLAEMQVMVG
jgi:hypothetical protein